MDELFSWLADHPFAVLIVIGVICWGALASHFRG